VRPHLCFPDRTLERDGPILPFGDDIASDLGLDAVLEAMAAGDGFVADVARHVLLAPVPGPAVVGWRHAVLRDFEEHPEIAVDLWGVALEAVQRERGIYTSFLSSPEVVLRRAVEVIGVELDSLRRLRSVAETHARSVRSRGLVDLFETVEKELSEDYLASLEEHLETLRFRRGVLVSAEVGSGAREASLSVRRPLERPRRWTGRLRVPGRSSHVVVVHERDEAGARALAELRGRALVEVANAAAQSADHVVGFFRALLAEVGWYLGCLNLRRRLEEIGVASCLAELVADEADSLDAVGLVDVALALREGRAPVPNDLQADAKRLVLVTGPNQGGKSTFLRALGLAWLLGAAGAPVAAERFATTPVAGVATHFRREEDAALDRGKLDEELERMSALADHLRPGWVLLSNESFAATNEQEGSEIADQVFSALIDADVRVVAVTFFFELANRWLRRRDDRVAFLRAERLEDGARTFRIVPGEPLSIGFAADVWREVFGGDALPPPGGGAVPQ
jgi:hypothetical protein